MDKNQILHESHLAHDEIDLKELFKYMWLKKVMITVITLIFIITTVIYAIQLPNIYRAEALLTPAEQDKSGGLASLAGQFGGIASLAGVDLGGGNSSQTGLAIEVLKSRKFTGRFIEKHNILQDLMAVEGWSLSSNKVIYNKDIFDPETEQWVREVEPPFQKKPSLQEAYIIFQDALKVELDSESGMISISMEHQSPYIAKKWVDWLINDINQFMRVRDVDEAEKSIVFLTEQLNRTDVSNMKSILYSLLEEQAKTIMFANVRTEYVFKTIDPAVVPEKKFKPSRALICILGAMAGFLISLFIVSIMYLKSDSEKFTYEQQNG